MSGSIGSVVGSIGGVGSSSSILSKSLFGLTGGNDGSLDTAMQQASYGGIPFGVKGATLRAGRKYALHEYPMRDEVWAEEMGKKGRRFSLDVFLLENDLVYKGGPVIAQRDAFLRMLEKKPEKSSIGLTLVHPTMGTINNVVCLDAELVETDENRRVIAIRLDLVVSGARKYPVKATSTTDQTAAAATAVQSSALLDFVNTVASDLSKGAAVIQQAVSTVVAWYQIATGLVHDIKRVFNAVSTLEGNFGALFGGANNGYATSNARVSATVANLLAADVVAVAAVAAAGSNATAAAATVSDSSTFGTALVTLSNAVAATASDPADAIRLLSTLASFTPVDTTTSSAVGVAMGSMQTAVGALARRTALATLATAAATYQPSSSDDALAVRNTVSALIDAEIVIAADAGDDNTYAALVALNDAVVGDLTSRGAQLAAMRTFTFASSINALTLATRIYRDPSRADQLISLTQPVHPAFITPSFTALES